MLNSAPLHPVTKAELMGRSTLIPAVRVRSVRDVACFADFVTERLLVSLDRRFDSVDHEMVGAICDAALSRMITIDPDSVPGVFGDQERVSLHFAEVVYASIRSAHSDHETMQSEWGFSGFHTWFAVVAADILAGFESASTPTDA